VHVNAIRPDSDTARGVDGLGVVIGDLTPHPSNVTARQQEIAYRVHPIGRVHDSAALDEDLLY
jgi:hypothetical protein